MSDFGTDAASSVFRFGTKFMEEFLKLLKFIFETSERHLNKELKKMQLEEARQKGNQLKREEKLEKKRELISKKKGLIKYKQLLQGGEPLYPVGYQCSQKEIEKLSRLAKMEGIPFAILKNSVVLDRINEIEKELKELKKGGLSEENKDRFEKLSKELKELEDRREEATVVVRESDLERFKDLTDRLNKEIRLAEVNEKIDEYEKKGYENLSEEEKKDFREVQAEKETILRDEFDDFNKKNNDVIIASTEEEPLWEAMNFESALARVTERDYATQDCYICERTNPENYIQVSSQKEVSKEGNPYVNTEYKVFHQGQQQRSDEFSHGKFTHYTDSKGESTSSYGQEHWLNMKKEIKEKGGFSNDVLIFASKERYEEYKDRLGKVKDQAIPREDSIGAEYDSNSYKDYAGVVNKLKSQLEDHKLAMSDNAVVRDNGETLKVNPEMTDDEKLETAEMINVGQQIVLYDQLNKNQMTAAFARNQMEMNEENFKRQGSPAAMREMYEQMKVSLEKQLDDCSRQEADLKSKVDMLQKERIQLRSVEVVEKVQDDTVEHADTKRIPDERQDNKEFTHREEITTEKTQTKAAYEKQISRSQNNVSNIGQEASKVMETNEISK